MKLSPEEIDKYIQNRTPKPPAGRDFDGMRGRYSIETEEEKRKEYFNA